MKEWKGTSAVSAGTGITPELSVAVNLLGEMVGEAVREQVGPDMLNLIEELRILCKDAYKTGGTAEREKAQSRISALTLEEINWLLRAYTAFFHLVNKAEQNEIVRINREREQHDPADQPRADSIAEAIQLLRDGGLSLQEMLSALSQLDIQPTFTAHPTEARRRTILNKQRRISELLQVLQRVRLTLPESEALLNELYQQISLLLVTDEIRAERPSVTDEVEHGIHFISGTIWETVPRIYQDIRRALQIYAGAAAETLPVDLPTVLRYRSWIGGDRDGNPFVTPEVTRRTLARHREVVLQKYREELAALNSDLSISSRLRKAPRLLTRSLATERKAHSLDPALLDAYRHEPFRLKIQYIQHRLELLGAGVTGENPGTAQYSSQDFISDLELLRRSLQEIGIAVADNLMRLDHLLIRARTFGFHLAALDIRQHSKVHEAAVATLLRTSGVEPSYEQLGEEARLELLTAELENPRPLVASDTPLPDEVARTMESFRVLREALRNDPQSIGGYIISMTHEVSDMLEVLLLAKEVNLWRLKGGRVQTSLDVVPLLETIEDLQAASTLMDEIFSNPVYRRHLRARGNFQEIMLGYSDSNKDGGYWMANWALYKGQRDLADACRRHGVDFRLFHGRGGTVGRGGGRANRAILALPPGSYTGRIRFTEQGEVITFRYSMPDLAHRHLEQIVNSMLQAAVQPADGSKRSGKHLRRRDESMERVSETAMARYRQLIHAGGFWEWQRSVTPLEHISQLPIASRPVSRKSSGRVDFEGLRAIPWVFSWTQTRYNLPGWFGIGSAIIALLKDDEQWEGFLQEQYREWPFLRTIVDNAQLEMKRTHLVISRFYSTLSEGHFHEEILQDFVLAEEAICRITGQDGVLDNAPVLQQSIALRNPYTDVLNLLQIELMRRWRSPARRNRETIRQALFLSINGIAAAMQSTG